MADHSIKGKVVLIAGGTKNLGGLIARDLTTAGVVKKLFADTIKAVGKPGYRHQYRRQGAEEADGGDWRGRVRRNDSSKLQVGLLLPQGRHG